MATKITYALLIVAKNCTKNFLNRNLNKNSLEIELFLLKMKKSSRFGVPPSPLASTPFTVIKPLLQN